MSRLLKLGCFASGLGLGGYYYNNNIFGKRWKCDSDSHINNKLDLKNNGHSFGERLIEKFMDGYKNGNIFNELKKLKWNTNWIIYISMSINIW